MRTYNESIMKVDANWQRYQSLNPRRYAGKYVVIAAGKLIGSGRNLTKLLAAARRTNPSDIPFVARMRDPRKVCIFANRANA